MFPHTTPTHIPGASTAVKPCEQLLTIAITDNIIHYMRTEAPLLAPIFRSAGQARLLVTLLLGDDELSITDLAEHANLAYPTAHREVGRLLVAGILAERTAGRTRLVAPNPDSPLVAPLRDILVVSTGPVVLLARELGPIEGVDEAFLYGSYAARVRGRPGPAPGDIDVMVIGTPDPEAVYDACGRVEERAARPINPTVMTRAELDGHSGFLEHLRANPVVPILGDAS